MRPKGRNHPAGGGRIDLGGDRLPLSAAGRGWPSLNPWAATSDNTIRMARLQAALHLRRIALPEGGSPRMQARQASPYLRRAHAYHRARKRWKTVLLLPAHWPRLTSSVGARSQRVGFPLKSIQSFNRARWKRAPTGWVRARRILHDACRHAISGLTSAKFSPASLRLGLNAVPRVSFKRYANISPATRTS